jgi:hypothetical protein
MKRVNLEATLLNQSNTAYTNPKFAVYRASVPVVDLKKVKESQPAKAVAEVQ